MERFDVLTGELPVQQDRSGYAWRGRRGAADGSRWLGASVYELPAGEWTFPYHYHHGVEEWLYVAAGAPTLRDRRGSGRYRPAIWSASRAARPDSTSAAATRSTTGTANELDATAGGQRDVGEGRRRARGCARLAAGAGAPRSPGAAAPGAGGDRGPV
jgi:hypothetical protein